MRIALVHPNYHSGGAEIAGNWPPAWVAYLSGPLKAAGYDDIVFIDAMTNDLGDDDIFVCCVAVSRLGSCDPALTLHVGLAAAATVTFDDCFDLSAKGCSLVRIDHGDKVGEAFDRGDDIVRVAPMFAGRAVTFDLEQGGSKPPQQFSRDVHPLVDHQSGDLLATGPAKDPRLSGMELKTLCVDGVPNPS